jgi:hypothetical protein
MKLHQCFGSAVVFVGFGITTVVSAEAQLLYIGTGPAGSVTTLAMDFVPGAPGVIPSISAAGDGDTFQATAQDWGLGDDLGSTNATTAEKAQPGVTTSVWVTETDLNPGPTPQKLSMVSAFTQNVLPEGATVTETTYFDASDTAYGTGTRLATETFTSLGSKTFTTLVNATNPYSITEEYDVTYSNPEPPTALSTITLTTTDGPIPVAPIPEPSTWAMMLLGFAGLGYAGYRQTKRASSQPL